MEILSKITSIRYPDITHLCILQKDEDGYFWNCVAAISVPPYSTKWEQAPDLGIRDYAGRQHRYLAYEFFEEDLR